MSVIKDQRGLNAQTPLTSKLRLKRKKIPYCGFDPTADSPHIGHLRLYWYCAVSRHTPIGFGGWSNRHDR